MTPLHQQPYILLSTRKRDGRFVPTAVWCAGDQQTLYAFSAGAAGKIKRLRNFSDCRLAPGDYKGKPLGEASAARAFVIDRGRHRPPRPTQKIRLANAPNRLGFPPERSPPPPRLHPYRASEPLTEPPLRPCRLSH